MQQHIERLDKLMSKKHLTEKQANELWYNFHESDENTFWKKYQALLKKAVKAQVTLSQQSIAVQAPPVQKSPPPPLAQETSHKSLPLVFLLVIASAILFLYLAFYPKKILVVKKEIISDSLEYSHQQLAQKTLYKKQGRAIMQASLNAMYDLAVVQRKAAHFYTQQEKAKQGNAKAQCQLGQTYEHGAMEDNEASFYWYNKSAKQGIAKAQYNLGLMYLLNHSVALNEALGNYWLRKSIEQKYTPPLSDNRVVSPSFPDSANKTWSFYHLRDAATLGDAYAQAELARILLLGEGVPKNEKRADYWIIKSAQQGCIEGINLLNSIPPPKTKQEWVIKSHSATKDTFCRLTPGRN